MTFFNINNEEWIGKETEVGATRNKSWRGLADWRNSAVDDGGRAIGLREGKTRRHLINYEEKEEE